MANRPGPKSVPTGTLSLHTLGTQRGERCINFVERYCRVPKGSPGAAARSKLILRDWQKDFIRGIFADNPPRQALLSISRKNGKTLLAACIALYALFADGVDSGEVLIVSSDERTASVCYLMAKRIIELEPRLANMCQVFKDRIYVPSTDSVLATLSGRPELAQGRSPHLSIVDECHVTIPELWTAMLLGQATREHPLTLGISTECGPGDPDNLMTRLVEYGRTAEDPMFYFQEFTAPAGCALGDRDAWKAANPQLYDTLSVEHLEAVVKTTREPEFRRYHLNQRVDLGGTWLPAGAWAAIADPGDIPDGTAVVLGVDGSYSGDFSGIVACSVSPRPKLQTVALFKPVKDEPVDVLELEQAIRDACVRWDVREVAFDPYRFGRSMAVLDAEGIPVVEFPQSASRMSPSTVGLYEAIVNRQVTHNGDKDLAQHFSNAVVRDDAIRGYRITKPSKHSPNKIDLAVCAILAHSRAAFLAGQKPKRKRVVAFA